MIIMMIIVPKYKSCILCTNRHLAFRSGSINDNDNDNKNNDHNKLILAKNNGFVCGNF